jgi:hypothetical protein
MFKQIRQRPTTQALSPPGPKRRRPSWLHWARSVEFPGLDGCKGRRFHGRPIAPRAILCRPLGEDDALAMSVLHRAPWSVDLAAAGCDAKRLLPSHLSLLARVGLPLDTRQPSRDNCCTCVHGLRSTCEYSVHANSNHSSTPPSYMYTLRH